MSLNKKFYLNRTVPLMRAVIFFMCIGAFFLLSGCRDADRSRPTRSLRIFHAAGFTPVIEDIREDISLALEMRLLTESSGSQVVCRKVEELGRNADLLILADKHHVVNLLQRSCSWRLDFATDEVALAIGARAPYTDEAEADWATVLLRDNVRFGMVDPNQGPIGYRALLTLKLEEQRRNVPGFADSIAKRSAVITDDVSRLAPLLKSGELDYAFMYRSTCIAMDVRFITLPPEINLSSEDFDYSNASVTYEKLGAGQKSFVVVKGSPAVWSFTVPDRNSDLDLALLFMKYLLQEREGLLSQNGFKLMNEPLFYGSLEQFNNFDGWALYAGEML